MDKTILLKALQSQYTGEMDIALANIEVYIHNPAAIGEHSEIAQALDIQVEKFANAKEKHDAVTDILGSNGQKTLVG